MAAIFHAVVVNGDIHGEVSRSRVLAELQLGEVPRRFADARIVALTEATNDRVAEVSAIRAALAFLGQTTAADRESAARISEAERLLGAVLKAGA